MDGKLVELVTQFLDSLVDLVAQRIQEKVNEAIEAKLSNYDPTKHCSFVSAVQDAMEGKVTMYAVTDAIGEALDRYDPADARYFGNSVVEAVRGEIDNIVRDVISAGTFELSMR